MNAPLYLLYPRLYPLIQEYRVTDEKLLPIAYQNVPGGQPLHGDWAFFRSTPRIDNAYRIPLPLKQISGVSKKVWVLWDMSYPTAPGTPIEKREIWSDTGPSQLAHALVDYAEEGWSEFAFWHHDRWVPCVKQYMKVIDVPLFGKRTLKTYSGLKADLTVSPPDSFHAGIKSDLMAWLEPSCSFNKL